MGTERQRSSPSRWRDEEGWAGDTAGVFLGCEPVRRHPPAVALPSWRRHSRTTAAVPTLSLPPFEGVSPPPAPPLAVLWCAPDPPTVLAPPGATKRKPPSPI